LFKNGITKIAQKVGEEATEVIIEALVDDKQRLIEESADLLFHLMVLWEEKQVCLNDVVGVLQKRHKSK
jgi:phosphoribosyl-ATP pyrophosphohydrolase/phosphoribosyl-AMP cyclohydrolase